MSTTQGTLFYVIVPAGEYVNVRQSPSKSSASVARLHRGDEIYASRYNDTWHQVFSPVKGFIVSEFVTGDPLDHPDPGKHPSNIEEAFGNTNLRVGSTGSHVKNLQWCMMKTGDLRLNKPTDALSTIIDGAFGTKTETAVKHYQARYHTINGKEVVLSVDGIVGPKTKECLWADWGHVLCIEGF